MENKFNKLGLDNNILRAIADQGFSEPSVIQSKAIPIILSGVDVVGLSQTGTGKTLAFIAPMLQKMTMDSYLQAIVLCPTRELAQQILVEVRKFATYLPHVRAVAVYGGADIQRQIYALKRGANIVIGTPGRVIDHINRHTMRLDNVHFAVLDEADEMLNMGFRADMEQILSNTPKNRQTIMFSATMSNDIRALANKFMRNAVEIKVGEQNTTISTVKQTYFITPKDKKKRALHALLMELPRGKTLVFCNTKTMVDGVQSYLQKMGYDALALHGDMPQPVRKRVLQEYRDNNGGIMVTTDIAARGIDVQDILHVVNFDLPQNKEYYIHRVGRTGRAGKTGNAWTLLNTPAQVDDLRQIEKSTKSTILQGNLSLDGLTVKATNQKPQRRGHNLNIKKREQRRIGASSKGQYSKVTRGRYSRGQGVLGQVDGAQQTNAKDNQNISGRAKVTVAGKSKRGTKTRTLRNVHKSKKQPSKIHF